MNRIEKKWVTAKNNLEESKDWLLTNSGNERLAVVLLRAGLTYDEDCPEEKRCLENIGTALGLIHPVSVYHAFSGLVSEGASQIVNHYDDDDEKVATCRAISTATGAVCNLVTQMGYWNAEEVVACLTKTAKLFDEQRIHNDLMGDDNEESNCTFRYNFEKGDVEIVEESCNDKSKDN